MGRVYRFENAQQPHHVLSWRTKRRTKSDHWILTSSPVNTDSIKTFLQTNSSVDRAVPAVRPDHENGVEAPLHSFALVLHGWKCVTRHTQSSLCTQLHCSYVLAAHHLQPPYIAAAAERLPLTVVLVNGYPSLTSAHVGGIVQRTTKHTC
jgi:hypothetical protein